MALSAKFIADFRSFEDAVAKAEVSLKSFDSGANKVSASLTRMTDSFSGRKLVQEATLMSAAIEKAGGLSVLTGNELAAAGTKAAEAAEKMRRLGLDVPPGIQKIADAADRASQSGSLMGSTFTKLVGALSVSNLLNKAVSGIVSIGTEALASAGALVDLSNKTGLSTETLQRMSFVAKQNGTDVGVFSDAMFKMGVNISEGTGKARKAAEDLGLSWQALRAASPDQQFQMVVQALEAMVDPQKRNEAGVALFGKTAKEILPAIVDGYTRVAKEASVAGDAQVRALDEAGDAYDRFKERTKNAFTNWIGSAILAHEAASKLPADFNPFLLVADKSLETMEDLDAAIIKAAGHAHDIQPKAPPVVPKAAASFVEELNESKAAFAALTDEQRKNLQAALDLGKGNDEIVNNMTLTEGVLAVAKKAREADAAATRDAKEAAKEYAAAIKTSADVMANILAPAFKRLRLEEDAHNATVARLLEISEHLIPNTRKLSEAVYGLGTQIMRYDGANEAAAVHVKALDKQTFDFLKDVKEAKPFVSNLADGIHSFAQELVKMAQVSGDSFGGVLKDIAQVVVGLDASFEAAKQFHAANTAGGKAAALAGVAANIVGGSVGKSPLQGLINGAVAGAAFTPAGAAIGAAIGVTVATFSEQEDERVTDAKKRQHDLLAQLNANATVFQKELQKTFDATATSSSHGADWIHNWGTLEVVAKRTFQEMGVGAIATERYIQALLHPENVEAFNSAMQELSDDAAALEKRWTAVGAGMGALTDFTKDGIHEFSQLNVATASAVGLFGAYVKKTGDVGGALAQLGPSLDAIQAGEEELGITGNSAIEQLLGLRGVAEANKPLLDSIAQSTTLLSALGDAGILTQDTLLAFGQQAVNQFAALSGATGDSKMAMVLMQPELQKLWEDQQKFGAFTDEATQKLIDQAAQQGIVGPDMLSDNDKLLKVMKEIRDVIAKATGQTGLFKDALDKLPTDRTVTVHQVFDTEQGLPPEFASTGGIVTGRGIQRFAGGGVVLPFSPRGSDTVPAMLTPGEMVLTRAQQGAMARGEKSSAETAKKTLEEMAGIRRDLRNLPKILALAMKASAA